MRSQSGRPVWHRTHANGWCANVQREEDGRYAYGAYPVAAAPAMLGHSSDLGHAQRLADAAVPEHACIPADCLPWEHGFACVTEPIDARSDA